MSYIPGLTLQQIVEKSGALDAEHVAWITERVLNALSYIHRHGVVHGDLKPQNIIVQPEKHMAVLVDFGLSAVKPSHDSEAKGYTPYYAPPEEIAGKPILPESDYYSLGMTMIYALAGNTDMVEQKRVPAAVPDELCAFIKRMIARDVNNRPQYNKEDLTDVIVDLRRKVFGRARSNMKPIDGV
jgi:serine/threonine protein kinase